MMEQSFKSKVSLNYLITTTIILTILNTVILLTIVGTGIYNNVWGSAKNNKVVFANVTAEQANAISGQIVYNGAQTSTASYYSPTLTSTLTYDSTKYTISEGTGYIGVYPKNFQIGFFNSIKVVAKVDGYSKTYTENLKKLYTDAKVEEEGTSENLPFIKYSYVKTDVLDKTKKQVTYLIVITRTVGDKMIVSETSYPEDFKITQYSSDISKLLTSINLNPTDIASKIAVKITSADLELSYDKDKWETPSVSEYSAFLGFRSDVYETEKDLKYTTSTVSVNTSNVYDSGDITAELKDYRKFDEDFRKDKGFKLDKDTYAKKIGDLDFIASDYHYTSGTRTEYVTLLVGKVEAKKMYVYIKVTSVGRDTVGFKEGMKVIETLKYTPTTATVSQAQTSENGNVLGTSTLEIDKAAIIGKPSVVHIYNRTCVDVKVATNTTLPKSSGKSFTQCSAGTGTGFYISSDGYIVTNGHVAKPNPLDMVLNAYMNGKNQEFWIGFMQDTLGILNAGGVATSSLSVNDLLSYTILHFADLNEKEKVTITPQYLNYIEGQEPFAVDIQTYNLQNESKHTKLTLVDGQVESNFEQYINKANNRPQTSSKPDLALLKSSAVGKYPSLSLANADLLTVGQKISVIGYPGSANNGAIFDSQSSRIATITSGTIGAIKSSVGNVYKLLQIDASVSYGNSGGPIINEIGEVVGVTTYKVSANESADFNAGVSVEEIRNMLNKNKISISSSEVTGYISSGLDDYSKGYYKYAIEEFNNAIKAYPASTEILNPIIAICNDKIAKGEDKTPIFDTRPIEKLLSRMGITISGTTVIVLLFVFPTLLITGAITVVAIAIKKRKDRSTPPSIVGSTEIPEPPKAPVAPSMPVQQPSIVEPKVEVAPIPTVEPQPVVPVPTPPVPSTPVQESAPKPFFTDPTVQNTMQPIKTEVPISLTSNQPSMPQTPPTPTTPVAPPFV